MSSSTSFLVSSSNSASLSSNTSIAPQNCNAARIWMESAESKLKLKPFGLKFRPRYKKAGDQFCLAASEFQKCSMIPECINMLEKASHCYQGGQLLIRAAKAMDGAFSLSLQRHGKTNSQAEVHRLALKTQGLYQNINQPDEAAAALDKAAEYHFKVEDDKAEINKGILLLKQGMNILECEGRPAQAGMFGMKLLRHSLKLDTLGPEMVETGKRCLKMFVLAGNVKMAGNCLIIIIFLLIKHFENVALAEGLSIYQDFVGLVSDDVNELIKALLHALNDRDFTKIEEIKKNESLLKTDKYIKELAEDVLTNIHETEQDESTKEDTMTSPATNLTSGGSRRVKNLATVIGLASGAALVATSVTASKSRLGAAGVREALDHTKEAPGPYADVTGFEHVQPHSVEEDQ